MAKKSQDIPEEKDVYDILVEGKFYQGNENILRSKDATFKWTEEMMEEMRVCTKSVLHFAENYFYITTEDGKQKIELYKYQKKLLRAFKSNRFNTVLSSRQSGKTTTITIYALWIVCFQSDKRITIVANKDETAKEIFGRIKMAFEQLPIYMKPSVKSWRKDGFVLGNDSAITVSTTSASGPRGSTSNLLIIDEMAHIEDKLMKELWRSAIPIISSMKRSQIVVISTPNGMDNKFYELVIESKKPGSEWHLEVVNWWDVPGRDEEWKKKQITLMGSKHDFDQEYDNKFHDPNKSVMDPELIQRLKEECIDPCLALDDGAYRIYELPNPESFYVVGVDVGEGIGRTNTVAQILDVSNLQDIKQVAIYATNNMNPFHFGTRLMGILADWGRPPVLIENNNNGQQVLDVVCMTHNYENVVTYQFDGMSKHYDNSSRYGIHNHTNTRYKGITNFRYWTNSLKVVKINDLETVIEIANFIQKANYTFTKKGEKDFDDRVFGLVWALFILDPSLVARFFYVNDVDLQGKPLSIKSLTDNRELLKNSPLLIGGGGSTIITKPVHAATYSHIGGMDEQTGFDLLSNDRDNLIRWLTEGDVDLLPLAEPESNFNKILEKSGNKSSENYYPTILF